VIAMPGSSAKNTSIPYCVTVWGRTTSATVLAWTSGEVATPSPPVVTMW